MTFAALLLAVAAAGFAAEPAAAAKAPARSPEETLRVMLVQLRQNHAWEVRKAMLGGAEQLRDAVAAGGPSKALLAGRLPGMAQDPFDLCRDLAACPEAPQALHVEEPPLIDDAFVALARPWFRLQEARGKAVKVSVEPGVGVRLDLQDLPGAAVVTLEAAPAPTGGFDVTLAGGADTARAYAAERANALRPAAL